MPPRPHNPEPLLLARIQARTEEYVHALDALDALSRRLDGGEALPDLCPQLQQVLEHLCPGDDGKPAIHDGADWEAPERKGAIDRQQLILETLLERVNQLAAEAGSQRARLVPQLDSLARGRQMRTAYAGAVTGEW